MQALIDLANLAAIKLYNFINSVWNKFEYILNLFRATSAQIPNWLQWLIVGTLITTGLWLIWQGLARKSRLLRPEALDLNTDNPEHLSGRHDDLQFLLTAVTLRPVVFLEGESGVGKSALIRAGLIPALRQTNIATHIIPIYMNCYGNDWDQCLYVRLNAAIWRALTTIEKQKLGIHNIDDWQQLVNTNYDTRSILNWLYQQLNQRLLLIFDQFDDYLITHHQHFLHNGCWLTANELIAQNAFWCSIYSALEQKNIHCLFVTRRRWAMGLEAVRFMEPIQRALNLVKANSIANLLSNLVKSEDLNNTSKPKSTLPVISNPNISWTALKELLIQDLTNNQLILPIQARIAFKGLQILPELSIEAYTAIGRLEGMETLYIQRAVLDAAKSIGISDTQAYNTLMILVDETIPLLPKARNVEQSVILAKAKLDVKRGTRLLLTLEHSGIIKRTLGATQCSSYCKEEQELNNCDWTLYHDYLARLVLIIQRRSERWQRLLQAKKSTFYAVTGIPAKWRALLSLKEQLGLIYQTLLGKVKWRGYRNFGILSTLRIVPLAITLLFILIVIQYSLNWQARSIANSILIGIKNAHEIDSPITGDALRQFWAVAAANNRLKRAFIKSSLTNFSTHPILIERLEVVNQALFGIDPKFIRRNWALNLLVPIVFRQKVVSYSAPPYQSLLATAIYNTNPQTFKHLAVAIANGINAASSACHDVEQLALLGQALSNLRQDIPIESIHSLVTRLVEAMLVSNDITQIIQLGQAVSNFGAFIPPLQLQLSVNRLVAVMRFTTNSNLLIQLAQILNDFGPGLPPSQMAIAAKYLVRALEISTDLDKLNSLAEVLINIAKNLQPQQKQEVAIALAKIIPTSKDREQLDNLKQILSVLAPQLLKPQAIIEKLAVYLITSHDPEQITVLNQSIQQLSQFLTLPQLKIAVTHLIGSMNSSPNPDRIADLANNLAMLITTNQNVEKTASLPFIQAGTERLISLITTNTIPHHLAKLGTALAAFSPQLPIQQIQIVTARLIEAMRSSTAPSHLLILGRTLANFHQQLPQESAQAGAERLLEILEIGVDSEQLIVIGDVLVELGIRLTNTLAIIERLFILLSQSQDRDQLVTLGLIVEKLILNDALSPIQMQNVIDRSWEVMASTANADTLEVLARIISRLIEKVKVADQKVLIQQIQTAATQLLNAMQSSTDWEQLVGLGNALGLIVQNKYAVDIQLLTIRWGGIERLVEAIKANTVPQQLAALCLCLGQLWNNFSPSFIAASVSLVENGLSIATPIQVVAEHLISVIRTNTDVKQLVQLTNVLNDIIKHLSVPQIQVVGNSIIAAMQSSNDEKQIFQLAQIFTAIADKLTPVQVQSGTVRLVAMLQAVVEHKWLIEMARILSLLGSHLSSNLTQVVADKLVLNMRINGDVEQVVELSQALIVLITASNRAIKLSVYKQVQQAALKLLEILQLEIVNEVPQDLLNVNLVKLVENLSLSQRQIVAERLVAAMQLSSDWRKLIILSNSFDKLGVLLPITAIQAGAAQVVKAMLRTTNSETFIQMATLLEKFRVIRDLSQIPAAAELLKAPLAVGITRSQILRFISRLAGNKFDTSDEFAAWSSANLMLNLASSPLSPFP